MNVDPIRDIRLNTMREISASQEILKQKMPPGLQC